MLFDVFTESARMLYLAAPFLLLGLAMAGLLHVLMPAEWIRRRLGGRGFGGVVLAALVGIPLPVCSCGVVPIVIELRRKKASVPACLSFLVTTPESGADSILFTWGLMGPLMAIYRPFAALLSALLGGLLAMVYVPEEPLEEAEPDAASCSAGCRHPTEPTEPTELAEPMENRSPSGLLRRAGRYGFVELLDELAFWLILGLILAGVLSAVLPSDLERWGLGGGLAPMLLMLVVGVPLYVCASASTPIAAALMSKGLSPGAALVFLLAGPATNAASLVLLVRTFGRRFVQVYLASVMLGALASGLALDALLGFFAWKIVLPVGKVAAEHHDPLGLAASFVLVILLGLSLSRGAWKTGWSELAASIRALRFRNFP